MRKYPKLKKLTLPQKEYMIQRLVESKAMKLTEAIDLMRNGIADDMPINEVFEKYGNMSEMQAKINAGKTLLIYKKPKVVPDFMMSKMDINF
jgi:hypothetical protein